MKIKQHKNVKIGEKNNGKIKATIRTGAESLAIIVCFLVVLSLLIRYTTPERYATHPDLEEQFNVVDTQGGQYLGTMIENSFAGQGQFQYASGGTYRGAFTDSKRNGEGLYNWPNGDFFEGTWEADTMVTGTYQFANGDKYVGEFYDNKFRNGTYTAGNGVSNTGITSLVIEWESGKPKSATLTTANGCKYDGEINGTAKIIYSSGNTYSGKNDTGIRQGSGTFHWVKTGEWYEGSWSNDSMEGEGTYHFSKDDYPKISGTFKNGKLDGKATYYKASGNTFETIWKSGKCVKVTES